jgi:hypothetical protein
MLPTANRPLNTACPPEDILGNPRPIDGDGDGVASCDMGAFE